MKNTVRVRPLVPAGAMPAAELLAGGGAGGLVAAEVTAERAGRAGERCGRSSSPLTRSERSGWSRRGRRPGAAAARRAGVEVAGGAEEAVEAAAAVASAWGEGPEGVAGDVGARAAGASSVSTFKSAC